MKSRPGVRALWVTWIALMALLALTFGLAHVRLGAGNIVASLGIAATKAALVALVFMELRRSPVLIVLFAAVALFGLALLFGLSGTDYATRSISPAAWIAPSRGLRRGAAHGDRWPARSASGS